MTEARTADENSGGASNAVSRQGADWRAAIDRVRATNAWIIKAFAGLAVLLIGSGPVLVKLGDLPSWRVASIAAISAVVALVGVGVVINAAATVMLPKAIDLAELSVSEERALKRFREEVEGSPTKCRLFLGFGIDTISEFIAQLVGWRHTLEQLYADVPPEGLDPRDLAVASEVGAVEERAQLISSLSFDITAARSQLVAFEERAAELLEHALYLRVRASFDRALRTMFIAAIVVAVGTGVYLGALGIDLAAKDQSDVRAVAATAMPATLTWNQTNTPGARPTADVRRELGLGDHACDTIPVLANGKGTEADPLVVTTLGLGTCGVPVITFTIDDRYARLKVTPPTRYRLDVSRTERDRGPALLPPAVALVVLSLVVGGVVGRRLKTK